MSDTIPSSARSALREAAAEQQLNTDEGKTKNDQQQEPKLKGEGSVYAVRTLAAEVARVAHYLLNDKRWTRKSASQMLATIARKMNAQSPAGRAWTDGEMRQLLGDAAYLGESHLVVVLHDGASVTELDSPTGASVLAVDPSRSTPRSSAVAVASSPTGGTTE